MPPERFGPGHAQITSLAHFEAEAPVEPVPVVTALTRSAMAQLLVQECAKLGPQSEHLGAVERRGGEGDVAHSAVTIGQ